MKDSLIKKINKKNIFLVFSLGFFVFILFLFLFSNLSNNLNSTFENIKSYFVFAALNEGYGYVDDPDPENPDPEPDPDPEEEPDYPIPNGFWPDADEKLVIEFQAYCYYNREGQILFSWTGFDPLKDYTFEIWKDGELILQRENLLSNYTLVEVKEGVSYGYGITNEVNFNESYTARVRERGGIWVYYNELIDENCTTVRGMQQPPTFENIGDCNPDGFNVDDDYSTFTTVSHPFPYSSYTYSPETLEPDIETTFTFTGSCYEVDCAYYKWTFENANPSIVQGTSTTVATTTFLEEGRKRIELTVRDEDDYSCSSIRNRRIGIIYAPTWREIIPWQN